MTAIERVLREFTRIDDVIENGCDKVDGGDCADDANCGVFDIAFDALAAISSAVTTARDAATSCPRCAYVGDGDCACPAVRR